MEKRIKITEKQYDYLYKRKPKNNEYFICVGHYSGGGKYKKHQLVFFDSLKEAEKFNESIRPAFNIALNI